MTASEVHDTIVRDAGIVAATYRPHSVRMIDLAIRIWPNKGSWLLGQPRLLGPRLKSDVKRRYREEYGFSPIALLILGAIINALIQWYFRSPERHQAVLERMQAEWMSVAER